MKKLFAVIILFLSGYIVYDMTLQSHEMTEAQAIDSISQGELILVNRNHSFQSNAAQLVELQSYLPSYVEITGDYLLNEQAAIALSNLFKQAKKDGVSRFKINSAYRDEHLQQKIYEETGEDYALPAGFSEHQTGLALDIGSKQGVMGTSAEGIWLANYASQFGFILRYPENKTAVTGISFEPWHFRYVGYPHSMIMKEQELVLEEYISYIKQLEEIVYEGNDGTYIINYVKEDELNNYPTKHRYSISGDNVLGYIVTYKK